MVEVTLDGSRCQRKRCRGFIDCETHSIGEEHDRTLRGRQQRQRFCEIDGGLGGVGCIGLCGPELACQASPIAPEVLACFVEHGAIQIRPSILDLRPTRRGDRFHERLRQHVIGRRRPDETSSEPEQLGGVLAIDLLVGRIHLVGQIHLFINAAREHIPPTGPPFIVRYVGSAA